MITLGEHTNWLAPDPLNDPVHCVAGGRQRLDSREAIALIALDRKSNKLLADQLENPTHGVPGIGHGFPDLL